MRIAFPLRRPAVELRNAEGAGSGPGFLNQPDDAFLLRDGTYTVADAKNCRILHIGATGNRSRRSGPRAIACTTRLEASDIPTATPHSPTAMSSSRRSTARGSPSTRFAGALVWTVHLPITYPSDPQQLGPDLYLVSDYAKPGGILEFTREGRIVWTYRPTSGPAMLDHPSLAERLPNGLIGVNDDYRHRVAFIDPVTNTIVWQYGQTDQPGTGVGSTQHPRWVRSAVARRFGAIASPDRLT